MFLGARAWSCCCCNGQKDLLMLPFMPFFSNISSVFYLGVSVRGLGVLQLLRACASLTSHLLACVRSTSWALLRACFFLCTVEIVWGMTICAAVFTSLTSTWEADKELSEGLSACLILFKSHFCSGRTRLSPCSVTEICLMLTTISAWAAKSLSQDNFFSFVSFSCSNSFWKAVDIAYPGKIDSICVIKPMWIYL